MPGLDDVSMMIGRLESSVNSLADEVRNLRGELKQVHTPLTCPLAGQVDQLRRWQWVTIGGAGVLAVIVQKIIAMWPWGGSR